MFDENYVVPTKPPLYLFEGKYCFRKCDLLDKRRVYKTINLFTALFFNLAYEGPDGIDWDNPWDLESSANEIKLDCWMLGILLLNIIIFVNFSILPLIETQ